MREIKWVIRILEKFQQGLSIAWYLQVAQRFLPVFKFLALEIIQPLRCKHQFPGAHYTWPQPCLSHSHQVTITGSPSWEAMLQGWLYDMKPALYVNWRICKRKQIVNATTIGDLQHTCNLWWVCTLLGWECVNLQLFTFLLLVCSPPCISTLATIGWHLLCDYILLVHYKSSHNYINNIMWLSFNIIIQNSILL